MNRGKADTYLAIQSIPSQEQLDAAVEQATGSMDRAKMEETLLSALTAQAGLDQEEVEGYVTAMSDEELTQLFTQMVQEQYKAQYAAGVQQQMAGMDASQLAAALDAALDTYTAAQCGDYYDQVLTFSDSTYEDNLLKLGYVDLDDPASINLYAASFEDKDVIEQAIADYNDSVDDLQQIQYTDYIGLMMSSITTIINAITYVLIAFVAVSLIVSSIMIGVITLISVQERTKEIGILRAIGASKRNVSRMFNAETIIIGFASGALGVIITGLLCIPINAILHSVTGIQTLNAYLPPSSGLGFGAHQHGPDPVLRDHPLPAAPPRKTLWWPCARNEIAGLPSKNIPLKAGLERACCSLQQALFFHFEKGDLFLNFFTGDCFKSP